MTKDPTDPRWWQIVLGIEAVLFAIALVMPVTPSKTGSDWSPAELVVDSPGYLQDVVAHFVMGNVIVAVLLVVAVLYGRWSAWRKAER